MTCRVALHSFDSTSMTYGCHERTIDSLIDIPIRVTESLSSFLHTPDVRAARKVLIAPTQQAGVAVRSALARLGAGVAGLEVATPLGLARRIVEAADPARGARTVGPSTLAIQVACILHAMEEGEGRPLMRSATTIARSITEARSAGIDADGYRRLVNRDIGRIALKVYRVLERELQLADRRDAAGLLGDAARLAADVSREVLPDVLFVLDTVDLPGSAFRLVESVRARVPQSFRVDVPVSAVPPPAFVAADRLDWPVLTLDSSATRVEFVEAVGAESEIRSIVRLIAERGLHLDDVEIAYPGHHPYLGLAREVFGQAGIDATWAAGIAAVDTRPGQAVRAFLLWIADGLPSRALVGMLRTGLVALPGDDERRGLARMLASELDTVRVGRGIDGYRRALASHVFGTLEPLLGLVPGSGMCSPADLADAATAFVEIFAPAHSGDEAERVRDEIVTRFRELGEADGRASLRRLASRFAAEVEEMFVQARAARPGAVHVAPLSGAGYTGRPHLVVVGLDQRAFGSSRAEDSLIPDEQRRDSVGEEGGPVLPESTVRRDRSRWWLARAMAASSGRVTLVRSVYDLSNDAELYPATPWLEIRAAHPGAEVQVHAFRPSAGGDATGRATTLTEVFLAARHDPHTRQHVELLRPVFMRGERAAETAATETWTPFDGVMSVACDPWSVSSPLSPTRLEDLAVCPFRYFLRYELGVKPPDARDDETWMRPKELGTLIHAAFEAYTRDWIAGDGPGSPELLRTTLEDLLLDFIRVNEPPSVAVEYRVRRKLDAAARIFLHDVDEALAEGRTPIEAEFAFGGTRRGPSGDRNESYELGLDGLSIPLRGFVDRLDRLPDGRLVVIDYKSGGAYGFTGSALGDDGTKLQWALYALAMEDIFGSEVERSGYLFVGGNEVGLGLFLAPPDRMEMGARMRELSVLPVQGMFPQAAGSDACKYCDFKRVCGDLDMRKEQISAKIKATPDDSDLRHALDRWKKRSKRS